MREWRPAAVLTALLVWSWSVLALGAVQAPVPAGWIEGGSGNAEAIGRVQSWVGASNLQLVTVFTTEDVDEYAESIAFFESTKSLDPRLLDDPDAALAELRRHTDGMLGIPSEDDPVRFALFESDDEPSILQARFERDGIAHECVLAPSGMTTSIVVMSARAGDDVLYEAVFDDVVASLEGIEAPVSPFPRSTWRWAWLIGAIVAGVAVHFIALSRTDRKGDHRSAAHFGIVAMAALAAIAAGTTFFAVGDHPALGTGGVSLGGLILDAAGPLLGVGAAIVGLAYAFDRADPVQSGPANPTKVRVKPKPANLDPVHGTGAPGRPVTAPNLNDAVPELSEDPPTPREGMGDGSFVPPPASEEALEIVDPRSEKPKHEATAPQRRAGGPPKLPPKKS